MAKALFSKMNLQVNNFLRWTKATKTLLFGGALPPVPPCRCVPEGDPFNFLAIYKFSNNQEKLLFLPLVER